MLQIQIPIESSLTNQELKATIERALTNTNSPLTLALGDVGGVGTKNGIPARINVVHNGVSIRRAALWSAVDQARRVKPTDN